MHVVLVIVKIRSEFAGPFEEALLHNARMSVLHDPGCRRFDVCQDSTDPARWVLHEVYDHSDDHLRHRQSAHFLAYDRVAAAAVIDKTVIKGIGRHLPL
jgi:quinol monooxygenase YgiN